MTMGFKYQMVGCTSPTQLLQVTLNHLDALAIIVKEPSVAKLLEQAREMTIDVRPHTAQTVGLERGGDVSPHTRLCVCVMMRYWCRHIPV